MILPTKHVRPDRALIGVGAEVLEILKRPMTTSRLWDEVRGHRHEKGGKLHEMPAHHNLEAYLDAYIEAAGIADAKRSPLFRSARGRPGASLTNRARHAPDRRLAHDRPAGPRYLPLHRE